MGRGLRGQPLLFSRMTRQGTPGRCRRRLGQRLPISACRCERSL
jgi:hypothetical protein